MGVKAVYLCLAALAAFVCESSSRPQPICPAEEEIAPCSCKNVAYGFRVICANLKSSALLKSVLSRLAPFHVGNLLLHGLNLEDPVPDDLFKGMTISTLQVEDSKIRFKGQAFLGLGSSLEQLTVARCTSTENAENFRLAPLGKLDNLLYNYNRVEMIEDSWLQDNIPNVRKVNFDHNEITAIKGDAFANMVHLEEISVADNRLQNLFRSMLPKPAKSLVRIDFSQNILGSLPSDMFEDMPVLETVVFSGNELQVLPERTWSVIWNYVESVFLYDNPMVCDRHIDWIRERRQPVLKGSCVAPEKMVGKALKDVLSV